MPVIDVAAIEKKLAEVRALDWSKIPLEQAQEIVKEVEELDRFMASYGRVLCYKPNPKQLLFHNPPNRELPRVRLFLGGNRCLGGETIVDADGKYTVKELYDRGEMFDVWAYDEKSGSVVRAKAHAPFDKGVDDLYRVELDNGEWFVASSEHRVMTAPGVYEDVSSLQVGQTLYIARNEHQTYENRLNRTVSDSICHCSSDFHRCDVQPLSDQDTCLGASPSPDDAPSHKTSSVPSREDVQDRTPSNTQNCVCGHPSSLEPYPQASSPSVSQRAASLSHTACTSTTQPCQSYQEVLHTLTASTCRLQSPSGLLLRQPLLSSPSVPPYSVVVINITHMGENNKYDFNVPVYNNYYAGGVFHANSGKTHALVAEAFSFCIGERMWDGSKIPVRVPNRGRFVVTSYLDGSRKVLEPKIREIFPPELIKSTKQGQQGSIIEVRMTNGSWFDIVSSEQESMKHEGADLDWCAVDEPIPRDHWIANWRGLTDRSGYAFFSLTPLTEPWIKQELYDRALVDPNYYVVQASTRDNINYGLTEQAVDSFAEALSEDEKSVRIEGNFMSLTGMVYKEYRDQFFPDGHLVEPFEIPAHWPRFCGIDPHDRKPTHVTWYAIDETDDIYLYDEIAIGSKTMKEIAEAIKEKEAGQQTPPTRVLRIIDPNSIRASNVGAVGLNTFDEFTKHGLPCIPGHNDIPTGHRKVREFLKFNKTLRGERPRLFIFSSCRGTRRAIMNYIFDDRSIKGAAKDYRDPKENRVREKDKDYPDTLRYVMMFNPRYISRRKDDEGSRGYEANNRTTGY